MADADRRERVEAALREVVAAARMEQCKLCRDEGPPTGRDGSPAPYHGYEYRRCQTPVLSEALRRLDRAQEGRWPKS